MLPEVGSHFEFHFIRNFKFLTGLTHFFPDTDLSVV